MPFVPGASGNANGRPSGSRNKRTREVIEQILSSGGKDPLITLSEISSTDQDSGVRAMAANMLAPYLHSKVARPRSKLIEPEAELALPPLDSLEHAVESIAQIKTALVEGTLSTDDAQQLVAVDQAYIAGKSAVELVDLQERLTALEATISTQPTTPSLHVQGGLPPLPGCNISMPHEPRPRINGGTEPRLIDSAPALGEPVQEPE